jgi:predicted membrane channel-forming protein YqfA (hemolysin III family)
MLGIVWALALFGVIMKATRGVLRHRRLAMTLYLGTGWIGLTLIRPLALAIPLPALLLFNRRWNRLHSGHFIFHERAAALWPFRLASVRACRH